MTKSCALLKAIACVFERWYTHTSSINSQAYLDAMVKLEVKVKLKVKFKANVVKYWDFVFVRMYLLLQEQQKNVSCQMCNCESPLNGSIEAQRDTSMRSPEAQLGCANYLYKYEQYMFI